MARVHATPIFDELTERLREPWSAAASRSTRSRGAAPRDAGVLSAVEPDGQPGPERPDDRHEPVGAVVGGTGETVLSFAAPSRGRHARPR